MSLTHFSGPFFMGAAAKAQASRSNFLTAHYGASAPAGFPTTAEGFGGGVFMSPLSLSINNIPLALGAANIAASQSPAAGAIVLTAGTGVTLVTVNGQTRYRLDMPRALQVVSGGNDTGITFTITGYDVYGVPLVETLAGASGAAKNFNKAFFEIVSVTHTTSVAGTVTVGTRDVIGLPIRSDLWEAVLAFYNGALLTASTGYTAAVTTDPATAATGDVRGTYALQSAADGVKRLVVYQIIPNLGGTGKQVYGIDQFGG